MSVDIEEFFVDNPCDPGAVERALASMANDLFQDVYSLVMGIGYKNFGAFLLGSAFLISQIFTTKITNFAAFVASSILGNAVGNVLSFLAVALSSLKGVGIMLKYLAAKSLHDALDFRIRFARALEVDVDNFLRLLIALENLGFAESKFWFRDIERALPRVKTALRLLNLEISKTRDGGFLFGPISPELGPTNASNLMRAVSNIDAAISILSGGIVGNDNLLSRMTQLNRKYNVSVGGFTTGDTKEIISYFGEVAKQISDKNNINGTITKEGTELLYAYITDFLRIPEVSEVFGLMVITSFTTEHINSLGERFPIDEFILKKYARRGIDEIFALDTSNSGVVSNLNPFKALEDGKDWLKETLKNVGLFPTLRTVQYPDSTSTLRSVTARVKAARLAVLLQDGWLDFLNMQANFTRKLLKPARDLLTSVRDQMQEVLDNQESLTSAKDKTLIALDKSKWVVQLNSAKTLIASSIGTPVGFSDGSAASPDVINASFSQSIIDYNALIDIISQRVTEENARGGSDADFIFNEVNQTLSKFLLSFSQLSDPQKRQSGIASLQRVKFNLRRMITADSRERQAARVFITGVEANPFFNSVIKPAWEAFLEELKDINGLESILKEMMNGNLARLVNALQAGGAVLNDIKRATRCLDLQNNIVNDELQGLTPDWDNLADARAVKEFRRKYILIKSIEAIA